MKNFLYNKSDILVAAVIIIAALFIIWSRVDAIMDTGNYKPSPSTTPPASEAKGTDENVSNPDVDQPIDTPADSSTSTDPVEPTTPTTPTEPTTDTDPVTPPDSTTGQDTVFIISAGSTSGKIAEELKAQGLISNTQKFIDMLTKKNVETKVKAGEFTIPAGASVEHIIEIITK
jgi:cytoskeletal protein RodZ